MTHWETEHLADKIRPFSSGSAAFVDSDYVSHTAAGDRDLVKLVRQVVRWLT